MKINFYIVVFILVCLMVVSCENKNNSNSDYSTKTNLYDGYGNYEYNYGNELSSSTSEYKYNYKNGDYYNYDVSGYDENGYYVSGNVDIDEYGEGYIEDEDGNEKYIEVKWIDWGVMEGYDEDGVYYNLDRVLYHYVTEGEHAGALILVYIKLLNKLEILLIHS